MPSVTGVARGERPRRRRAEPANEQQARVRTTPTTSVPAANSRTREVSRGGGAGDIVKGAHGRGIPGGGGSGGVHGDGAKGGSHGRGDGAPSGEAGRGNID